MAKKQAKSIQVTTEQVESLVHVIRGQRVITDFDLGRLYGVTTKSLNQAVSRNSDRFPDDFSYRLTLQEFSAWWATPGPSRLHRTWRGDAF